MKAMQKSTATANHSAKQELDEIIILPLIQLSNVQNPHDIPLYWLVPRDPYNPYIGILKIPIYLGGVISIPTKETTIHRGVATTRMAWLPRFIFRICFLMSKTKAEANHQLKYGLSFSMIGESIDESSDIIDLSWLILLMIDHWYCWWWWW